MTKVYFNDWRKNTGKPWTLIEQRGQFVTHSHYHTEDEANAAAKVAEAEES